MRLRWGLKSLVLRWRKARHVNHTTRNTGRVNKATQMAIYWLTQMTRRQEETVRSETDSLRLRPHFENGVVMLTDKHSKHVSATPLL